MSPVSPATVSGMFANPGDELQAQLEERRKKILDAARVGSPGKITNIMGYGGNTVEQQKE